MSNLQVNNIQPYSGDTFTISGSFVDVPGVLTVDTSITSSGDLRFPNMGTGVVNPVVSNVSASGTSSLNPTGISTTNTTTFLDYGVNVISYSTGEDYCVKLPSTPTKGKELTVVNLSGLPVYIFPGVEGGSINGIVGGDTIIPSDGIAYKFVCWENPLPGGWSIVSNSPSTIIQSDVIGGLYITQSVNPVSFVGQTNQTNAFVSNALYDLNGQTLQTGNGFAYYPAMLHGAGHNGTGPTAPYAYFTPDPSIRSINSITIYTNLSSSYNPYYDNFLDIVITWASNKIFFKAGTYDHAPQFLGSNLTYNPDYATQLNWFNTSIAPFFTDLNLGDFSTNNFWNIAGMTGFYYGNANSGVFSNINQVPGTFTPANPSYTPISAKDFTGHLSANPGDPGTTYYYTNISGTVSDNTAWGFGKGLGQFFLGTSPSNVVDTQGDQVDAWFLSTFGFSFNLDRTYYINGLKLKIVIDYVPY